MGFMPFELNLTSFLWAQGALILFGLAFLLWKPKRRRGLLLKFDTSQKGSQNKPQLKKNSEPEGSLLPFEPRPPKERNLQVHFNYNGHTFEAYETLGIPPGASIKTVAEAFEEQQKRMDPQSRAFLEAAYQALNSTLKSSKN
ncbi:MAG: hypothetical protein GW917_00790 [Bdellovibrionales bacterium]|nr:hypothetical protein [Bdellovibrionales bacterium]